MKILLLIIVLSTLCASSNAQSNTTGQETEPVLIEEKAPLFSEETAKEIDFPWAQYPIETNWVDLIMTPQQYSPEELKQIYEYYINSDFSDIASELANRVCENPVTTGFVSDEHLNSPWNHSLGLTLNNAWRFHNPYASEERGGEKFDTLMTVLENSNAGAGRNLALREIKVRLHWGTHPGLDESLPPISSVVQRLETIAFNENEDYELRLAIVPLLFVYGDPNDYLALAINLSSKKNDKLSISEAFRFATPTESTEKLTQENYSAYLAHAFNLLMSIDDQQSGTGYFLAGHIGQFLNIKPFRGGQCPFAPDQRLEEYQGKHGLTDSFFQTTVDNAMAWWDEHKSEYITTNSEETL